MTYLLPPLNALRAFEAAARHLRFKQAAQSGLRRHPGYRCDPVEDGFLIVPAGMADCAEVETLRSCLLAACPPSTAPRRAARSRLPA